VSAWQIEAIKTLVESGAKIEEKGKYGYDALEISKLKGYEQITKFLEAKRIAPVPRRFPKVQINFEFE
jgi:ankyrin repeat protein